MGLGFQLVARCRPKTTLHEIAAWFAQRCEPRPAEVRRLAYEDQPEFIAIDAHPAGESVRVEMPEPGRAVFSAKTTTVGPGYHTWLIEQLERWAKDVGARFDPADQNGDYGDETDWFGKRDRAALEGAMLAWLKALANSLVRESTPETAAGWKLGMPLDAPDTDHEGPMTALGPRPLPYWKRVLADPRVGADFFAWWADGLGADFHLGRALCRMWSDVRWRPPVTDDEKKLWPAVLDDLARARALDPKRPYPYREWAELLGHLGRKDAEISAAAAALDATAPKIGYRRGVIRARPYEGVSIPIPGEFTVEFPDDGPWTAQLDERAVLVGAYASPKLGPTSLPIGPADPKLHVEADGASGDAGISEDRESSPPSGILQGVITRKRKDLYFALTVTIVFPLPSGRAWAIETWRGIRVGP